MEKPAAKRPRGRPEIFVKLKISPEEALRKIFAAAKKPNTSLRKPQTP